MSAPPAVTGVDVLIAGAGPAGMSTALHLCRADPSWARRILVVDKAIFPRPKLCGGGVTQPGADILTGLGLEFDSVHITIDEVHFVLGEVAYVLHGAPAFRVVRRDEFDHWLVQQGEKQGVEVRQGEAIAGVVAQPDGIEVQTERGAYRARVLVAADGSNGAVRRSLHWDDGGRKARLLEVLTPEAGDHPAFAQGRAVFDFTPLRRGLQGYYWDFPSLVGGQPFMNRGVYDSRAVAGGPRLDLKNVLAEALARRNLHLPEYALKGHPLHWFDSAAVLSRPHVLLAGDAAGADPLLGEGISFALAYGKVAAAAILTAFQQDDFSFDDYTQRIGNDPILRQLRGRSQVATLLYRLSGRPGLAQSAWTLAPLLLRLASWLRPAYFPIATPRLTRLA
ncbi:MAG: FAD-dependent monooxygenase [Caldilineales bacterium]|nr:FAD-dependent monooxygenase [Caldilineales bacterium]MCW5857135.1 FAD-dependent monooxygenase [Caldilineales bacterium]